MIDVDTIYTQRGNIKYRKYLLLDTISNLEITRSDIFLPSKL